MQIRDLINGLTEHKLAASTNTIKRKPRKNQLKAVVNEYAGKEDITISKEMNSNTHLIKSDSSKVIKTRDLL